MSPESKEKTQSYHLARLCHKPPRPRALLTQHSFLNPVFPAACQNSCTLWPQTELDSSPSLQICFSFWVYNSASSSSFTQAPKLETSGLPRTFPIPLPQSYMHLNSRSLPNHPLFLVPARAPVLASLTCRRHKLPLKLMYGHLSQVFKIQSA